MAPILRTSFGRIWPGFIQIFDDSKWIKILYPNLTWTPCICMYYDDYGALENCAPSWLWLLHLPKGEDYPASHIITLSHVINYSTSFLMTLLCMQFTSLCGGIIGFLKKVFIKSIYKMQKLPGGCHLLFRNFEKVVDDIPFYVLD